MSSPTGNPFVLVPPQTNIPTGLPQKKKKRKTSANNNPRFWTNAREYFTEYTNTVNLDGFRYLGERNRSKFERILWLVIIGVSLGICGFLILDTYKKWESTPVIITFAHKPMPVWKVPFPAITICPEQRYWKSASRFLETKLENVPALEKKEREYVRTLDNIDEGDNTTVDEDIFEFLERVSPSGNKIKSYCQSIILKELCSETEMISKVITKDGLCVSFNILGWDDIYKSDVYHPTSYQRSRYRVTNWSVENGYADSPETASYPFRTIWPGDQGGITIYSDTEDGQFQRLCLRRDKGLKILLHNPAELPQISEQYFRVPLGGKVTVAVKPDVITTSNALRNYDPQKKGCYFDLEKPLSFYKNYTQQNCLMECLTNHTLDSCGCVLFYMPRRNTTGICGSSSLKCAESAKLSFVYANAGNVFNESVPNCHCLPSCYTLTYNAEISQTLHISNTLSGIFPFPNKPTTITIFFKDMQFPSSERNELYGATDFLANCGGLLGLFVGFSLISLLETLYFLTVRLGINLWKYGRHYWSGSEDLLQNKTDAKY